MKTSARCAACFLVLLLLSGCMTSTHFAKEPDSNSYPVVPMEQVKVFWTIESAPPHEVLGILTFKGDAVMLKSDDIFYPFIRRKAGERGANGIILESGHEPGTVSRALVNVIPIPGLVHRQKTVLAIRYKEVK